MRLFSRWLAFNSFPARSFPSRERLIPNSNRPMVRDSDSGKQMAARDRARSRIIGVWVAAFIYEHQHDGLPSRPHLSTAPPRRNAATPRVTQRHPRRNVAHPLCNIPPPSSSRTSPRPLSFESLEESRTPRTPPAPLPGRTRRPAAPLALIPPKGPPPSPVPGRRPYWPASTSSVKTPWPFTSSAHMA